MKYLLLLLLSSSINGRTKEGNELLTVDGELKEPIQVSVCADETEETQDTVDTKKTSETCQLVFQQTIPVKAAGTGTTSSSTRPECAPLDVICDPPCPQCNKCAKYRTLDGTCNNLNSGGGSNCPRLWGSVNRPLVRLLDNNYQDSLSEPMTGLPNPRTISNALHNMALTPVDDRYTMMLMQFGQFLDHDISLTPEINLDLKQTCCDDPSGSSECFPINIPLPDPVYSDHCKDFVRSAPHCTETSEVRQQLNTITAYIDGSMIYGSDASLLPLLRQFSDGLMIVNEKDGKDYMPTVDPCPAAGAYGAESTLDKQFLGGDKRVTENPGLASLHTIFLREHNRIATEIKSMTTWGDEKIFQETRRIVVAELQNIVYREFLPLVLGSNTPDHNVNSAYDDSEDATVLNVFATAAYRFGHSLIAKFLNMPNSSPTYNLEENFFDINEIWNNGQLDNILQGATKQQCKRSDPFVSNAVRNNLFKNIDHELKGMDLVARNIQRGRDHGLPPFKKYREDVCGLVSPPTWQVSTSDIESLYGPDYYDKLDVFPGGLLEEIEEGLVGPTFNCLLKKQFESLKKGDRFFFTHQTSSCHGFSTFQQDHIMTRSLRDIICDNTDVTSLQPRVMIKGYGTSPSNPIVACPSTSTLNVGYLLPSPLCCHEVKEEFSIATLKTEIPTVATGKIDHSFVTINTPSPTFAHFASAKKEII